MTDAVLRVDIDGRPAVTGARQVNVAVDSITGSAERADTAFATMRREIATARTVMLGFAAIVTTVAVGALSRAATQSIDYADRIGTAADRVGVATETLQEFRFAAEDSSNVLANQADIALQRFTRRVGEAINGGGELLETIQQYDIELRNNDGTVRSITDVLGDYADVVQNAESTQEQLRLAFKAFDSEGAALVNLLRQGREGWEAYAEAAREAGILTDQQIREAQQLDGELTRLSQTLRTDLAAAFIELGPVIQGFVNAVSFGARAVAGMVETIERGLARLGLGEGPNPNIIALQALLDSFDSTGRFTGIDGSLAPDAALALNDLGRRDEAFAAAVETRDATQIAEAIRAYLETQQVLADIFAGGDGAGVAISGGGSDGNAGEQAIQAIRNRTEALRDQGVALGILDEQQRIAATTASDLARAFAENGVPIEDYRDEIVEVANEFAETQVRFNEFQQAVDLVSDALGEFSPSAEVMATAINLLDAALDANIITMEQYLDALAEIRERAEGGGVSVATLGDQMGQAVTGAFSNMTLSAEGFMDTLANVAERLASIILQTQVLEPLAGAIGPGINSALGALGLNVDTGHAGGIAGELPNFTRLPRYHSGGLAGDETLAVLRRNEEVLTRGDPRHRANGGMASAGITFNQVINLTGSAVNQNGDIDEAAKASIGRETERMVRSIIQREIAEQRRVGGISNPY